MENASEPETEPRVFAWEEITENSWENCRKSGEWGMMSRKLLSIRRRVENAADEKGKCGTVGRKRMQKQ